MSSAPGPCLATLFTCPELRPGLGGPALEDVLHPIELGMSAKVLPGIERPTAGGAPARRESHGAGHCRVHHFGIHGAGAAEGHPRPGTGRLSPQFIMSAQRPAVWFLFPQVSVEVVGFKLLGQG